jgi:ankyrin repeat protein
VAIGNHDRADIRLPLNPHGYHSHATPLYHAALYNCADVVRLFVERGARLDIRDTIYSSMPLDWAIHGGWMALAEYLREQGTPAK